MAVPNAIVRIEAKIAPNVGRSMFQASGVTPGAGTVAEFRSRCGGRPWTRRGQALSEIVNWGASQHRR